MAIHRTVLEISAPVLGGTGTNTFHFRTTGELEEEVQLDAAGAALDLFIQAIAGLYPNSATISHSGEWITVSEEEPRGYNSGLWSYPGTGGTDSASPLLCMVVGWRTPLATRQGRGRTFVGPLSSGAVQSDGTPEEGHRATLLAAALALIATFDSLGLGQFVVWSTAGTPPGTGRDFVTAVTRNEFAYLSSRRD